MPVARRIKRVVAGGGAPGLPNFYNTTFPTDEDPLSEGGIWVGGATAGADWTSPKVVSGRSLSTINAADGYRDSVACISTSKALFGANQRVTAIVRLASGAVGRATGGMEVELGLRMTIGASNIPFYECLYGLSNAGFYAQCIKQLGPNGSFVDVGATYGYDSGSASVASMSDGDEIVAEINGNTITFKINGATQYVVTDSSGAPISSGQPGIGHFWRTQAVSGTFNDDLTLDSFSAVTL